MRFPPQTAEAAGGGSVSSWLVMPLKPSRSGMVIGYGRIADPFLPAGHRQPRRENQRAGMITIQHLSGGVIDRRGTTPQA
jgi:hypothetical protein